MVSNSAGAWATVVRAETRARLPSPSPAERDVLRDGTALRLLEIKQIARFHQSRSASIGRIRLSFQRLAWFFEP